MTTDGAVLRTRTRLVALLTALVPLSLIAAFTTLGTSGWRLIGTIALLAASRECWSRARDEKKGRPFARGARIDGDRALIIGERARVARRDVLHASSTVAAPLCVETNGGVEYKIEVTSGEAARWLDALGARGLCKPQHARFDSALGQLALWTLGAPTIAIACLCVTREVFSPRGAEIGEAMPGMVLSVTLGLVASAFVSVRCMGRELRVGSDGMLVRAGLSSRFVSYAQLREVTLSERSTLELSFVDGTTQTVSLAGGADPLVLFERIVEARARATDQRRGRAADARAKGSQHRRMARRAGTASLDGRQLPRRGRRRRRLRAGALRRDRADRASRRGGARAGLDRGDEAPGPRGGPGAHRRAGSRRHRVRRERIARRSALPAGGRATHACVGVTRASLRAGRSQSRRDDSLRFCAVLRRHDRCEGRW